MTPEQLRRLANLVDDLEVDGYRVTDAELLERRDDGVVAAVELSLPEDDATSASPGAAAAASGISAFPGRVPVSDDEAAVTEDLNDSPEEDNADGPEDKAEDPDCDETVELTDAEQDIVDVLEDEGELPRSEIKLLTGRSGYLSKILPRLRDKDILEHRKDPEDGRRYLYSLARDNVVDQGTGGGHELPDTSDIGTGELTPAVRALDEEVWAEMSAASQNGRGGTADIQTRGFASDEDNKDGDGEVCYPYVCSCGVVCKDNLARRIHRTEAHGTPQGDLGYLQPGEFETLVRQSDTVSELADALEWQQERTLRALGIYGFEDATTGGDIPDDPAAREDLLRLGPDAKERVSPDA